MIRFFNHCGRLTLPIVVHTMADIMAKQQVLQDRDKRFILEKLWFVAHADGRIADEELAFVNRVAGDINMTSDDVETARLLAQSSIA